MGCRYSSRSCLCGIPDDLCLGGMQIQHSTLKCSIFKRWVSDVPMSFCMIGSYPNMTWTRNVFGTLVNCCVMKLGHIGRWTVQVAWPPDEIQVQQWALVNNVLIISYYRDLIGVDLISLCIFTSLVDSRIFQISSCIILCQDFIDQPLGEVQWLAHLPLKRGRSVDGLGSRFVSMVTW